MTETTPAARTPPGTTVLATEILVVPHTHWDRAWYWPFERMRAKLTEMFEVLLDLFDKEPDFRFTLDGQTIALEDYLEARPDRRGRIEHLIRQGRLVIGPMYNLSDVYCTGTEALIRNLQEGLAQARTFGCNPKMLHMADTFGITPVLPMICAGFNFKAFSFMRGHPGELPDSFSMRAAEGTHAGFVSPRTRMFRWRCPDGSEIPVFRLRDGYASGAGLARYLYEGEADPGLEGDLVELLKRADSILDEQGNPHVLMAGVDHQIPQARLPRLLELAHQRQDRFRFRFALYEEVADEVARLPASMLEIYQGEFHGRGAASVLGGTVSTRIYLKADNAQVERLLTDTAEPATAFVNWLGRSDPSACCLRIAWKHLLRTHPHDDICGCSVDSVHRLNEQEFEEARHAADAVRRRMVFELGREYGMNPALDNRPSLLLMRMQGRTTRLPVRVPFDFEGLRRWGDIQPPAAGAYRIVDDSGTPVPFREVWRGQSVEHPHPTVLLDLYPELKPARFTRLYLEPADPEKELGGPPPVLENEFLRVEVVEGNAGFHLVDRSTGQRWENLGLFSSQADIGDEYDFADIPDETEQVFHDIQWKKTGGGGRDGVQSLLLEGTIPVPTASDRATQSRSRDLVDVPLRMDLTLGPGQRQLDVRVRFTNTARDHRLRWNMTLPFTPQSTRAGVKLQVIERGVGTPPTGDRPPRVAPIHPADEFVAVTDPEAHGIGLAVFSRFPFEYECLSAQKRLALTILRAVGWLSTPVELTTRPGLGAGPMTATPEAQCVGRSFDFSFALRPFSDANPANLLEESLLWRSGAVWGQLDATMPFVNQKVADPQSLFKVGPPVVVLACKPNIDGQGTYLRLFNPVEQAVVANVLLGHEATLTPVTLDEWPDPAHAPVTAGPHAPALFPLPPYGWISLRLDRPKGPSAVRE